MKLLVPLLLTLVVNAGQSAEPAPASPVAVNSQVLRSDREFLQSHSETSAEAPVTPPAAVAARREPVAPRQEEVAPRTEPVPVRKEKVARVAPKREAVPAPVPTQRTVTRSQIVLGDPVMEKSDSAWEDEGSAEVRYVRRERMEDAGYAPREEGHRRLHIRRFIHRLLPF